jgi:hypothetical protein
MALYLTTYKLYCLSTNVYFLLIHWRWEEAIYETYK